MPAKKRTTEIRQNEIAKAALELIGARGMKGLRVATVARKVGLVPSGIYRHYRSKDALLDAILDYIHHSFSANARAVARLDADALERLHALLTKHIRLIRDNASIPLVVLSPEIYAESPRRRVRLLGIIESYLAEVAALVEQGQREGTIRKDLDPGTVAVLFLGLVQPSIILWQLSCGRYDIAKQAEAAWPMFRRAIVNDFSQGERT